MKNQKDIKGRFNLLLLAPSIFCYSFLIFFISIIDFQKVRFDELLLYWLILLFSLIFLVLPTALLLKIKSVTLRTDIEALEVYYPFKGKTESYCLSQKERSWVSEGNAKGIPFETLHIKFEGKIVSLTSLQISNYKKIKSFIVSYRRKAIPPTKYRHELGVQSALPAYQLRFIRWLVKR